MGIMVYSLLWVMQDFVHQPYGDACLIDIQQRRLEVCIHTKISTHMHL